MARQYTKKNAEYWASIKSRTPPQVVVNAAPAVPPTDTLGYVPHGTPEIAYGEMELRDSHGSVSSLAPLGRGRALTDGTDPGAFQCIRAIPLPYVLSSPSSGRSYIGMQEAIELCVRAWAGVPVVRNAIEGAVEFSNQPLYIKTENKQMKTFFTEWFNAVQMHRLKEEFFREYYRSGNVFLFRFDGKFGPEYYKGLPQAMGGVPKDNKVPIRYSILNPGAVYVPSGITAPYSYVRLLSTYEVLRLKNPMTEQDKQVFNSLPEEVKVQIRQSAGAGTIGVYMPLDGKRLRYAFYKKQSYEAMAVPMAYPVLPDVEWKLLYTKMDKALASSVEHAILLVTNGEAPTKENGGNGINQNNIARLQSLFQNQTVGRVLVADYTTEAEWKIPDLKDILGDNKYKVVNENIREGLQSIFGGADEKFANAQIKAKIFIQRLEEGQRTFLSDFLIPEIIQICDTMGFRQIPEIGFQKIDLQDEAVMARIYAQLASLGVLTADQAVKAIESGILPDKEEMYRSQEEYKKARDKEQFLPLVGGTQKDDGAAGQGRPSGGGQAPKKVSPMGKGGYSGTALIKNMAAQQALVEAVQGGLKKKFKLKGDLNVAQGALAEDLARTIMLTRPKDKWVDSVAAAITKPGNVAKETKAEIAALAKEHGVSESDAVLLWSAKTEIAQEVV